MKDIVTVDQILKLSPSYTDDFPPVHKQQFNCPDPMAKVLEKMGYVCIESSYSRGQQCFRFERDPWESQVTIHVGQLTDSYGEYCQAGNTEDIE